jgi:hypothetical protein
MVIQGSGSQVPNKNYEFVVAAKRINRDLVHFNLRINIVFNYL